MPEAEVGTEDKVVAVGGENGVVAIIQIMDRDIVNQIKLDSGILGGRLELLHWVKPFWH